MADTTITTGAGGTIDPALATGVPDPLADPAAVLPEGGASLEAALDPVPDPEPAAPVRGIDVNASNYVFKLGTGGTLVPFSPDSYSLSGSFETVAPFKDKDKAGGGGNGLVLKVGAGMPFAPTDGSAAVSDFQVGYRLFGPEIWVGGASSIPYADSADDGEKGKWGEAAFTYQVRGALRFFAKDYKNDTDLPLFNLSAGLSGPEFGLGTFDSFTGSVNYNPAIHGTWARDVDGDGTVDERIKTEDAYLLLSPVSFTSTRLDEEGFLTGLSLDRDTQRAEGMAFDNSFSTGATAYIGVGGRNPYNGQRPYMLSLSGSYATAWDLNPAADPEYNEDLTQYYRQDELTPQTGDWAVEARFNFKDQVEVDDGAGGKTKAPMTPHQMIVNDPTASIAVSLASSSSYYLGGWHYPYQVVNEDGVPVEGSDIGYIGGDTNYRDLVEGQSLVLGLTGTYSKYTRSMPLFGGTLQVKPAAGITYDLSQGIDDADRFGFNAALSIGYKKKGQL